MQQSLIEYFIAEAEDHINKIEKGILHLETNPHDLPVIEEIFRAAHTLKGSAALVKLSVISKISHLMEDVFEQVKNGKKAPTADLATWMLKGLDNIKWLIKLVREGQKEDETVLESFKASLPGEKPVTPAPTAAAQTAPAAPPPSSPAAAPAPASSAAQLAESPAVAPPPVIEKREFGRRREDVEVESKYVRIHIDNVEQIMNIMGEITIIKNYLMGQVKGVAILRDEIIFAGRRLLNEVSSFSDKYAYNISIPDKVKYVDPLLSEFHELEFDRYDELNLFSRKLQEITDDINESLKSLSEFFESLSTKITALDKLTVRSKELVSEARMVDVGRLYQRFTRAVRDISLQHGKKIRFLTSGYETKIDKIIFEKIYESLLHILRNAIAHGLELPADRLKKMKPEEGTIHLSSRREGNTIVIEVTDDGKGIDFDAIRAKAIKKGLIKPEKKTTKEELVHYIFVSGFSTADKADMTSGRGVGLDVVKETLSAINGTIEIRTEKDAGTTFRLKVPLSLVIINVIIFSSGGIEFIVPSTIVQELMEAPIQDISDAESLQIRDAWVPLHHFNTIFGLHEKTATKNKPVLVLNISGKSYAVVVDHIVGQEDTIIKPFGKFLEGIKFFSGVSISADGKIRPVVNSAALVNAESIAFVKGTTGISEAEKRHNILIVDDSLSVRKLISMILTARNFNVFTATNGLEALNVIDENRIDLVITDLEMPVMHGYELLGELRRRGLLDILSAVVLTSRSGEKHEQKALSLGASDYLVKPFEEEQLLDTVKRNLHSVIT